MRIFLFKKIFNLFKLVHGTEAELQNLKGSKNCANGHHVEHKKHIPKWRQQLERRVYILTWIKTYDKEMIISDMIAGLTLGLTLIPQSIAYAAIAGLSSEYGLYSAFIGSLVYVFFGTVKQISVGPTALMSLMTLQYTMGKPPAFAAMLAFIAGCVELLMGILNLGFIVSFISVPVITAFSSATALIVTGSQMKHLFGIKHSSNDFFDSIYELAKRIHQTQMGDFVLGLFSCCFLLALKQLTTLQINTTTTRGQIVKKSLMYISIARNAILVLITSYVAYLWTAAPPFQLSGKVSGGIPSFSLPPFQIEYNNSTLGFFEIVQELGSGILVVPLVAVLENTAIAKAFSTGAILDASQEMLTIGLCNVLGSCFKAMPTCGAFSRSAVSQASGVRSPMSGLYAGLTTLLALSFLTPYFYFIPKASLASVIIIAVIFMIDIHTPIQWWHKSRCDFYIWLTTLFVCLLSGIEVGLLVGVAGNVAYLLFLWARPNISIQQLEADGIEYIYITPSLGIFYPGVDFVRESVTKISFEYEHKKPIVLDCSKFSGIDYTAAQGINSIATDLSKQNQYLILKDLDPDLRSFISLKDVLLCNENSSLSEILKTTVPINEILITNGNEPNGNELKN